MLALASNGTGWKYPFVSRGVDCLQSFDPLLLRKYRVHCLFGKLVARPGLQLTMRAMEELPETVILERVLGIGP